MNAPAPDELARLYASLRATGLVTRLIELARDEDLGPDGRDVTSELFIDDAARLQCRVVARGAGVVAGLAAIPDILDIFGVAGVVDVAVLSRDGSPVEPGERVVEIEGHARSILKIERTLLNLFGRLSGIATMTRRYAEAMGAGYAASLHDTRKTTPGLRIFEKYAVRCGGGKSHRLGLHDAVLVKDNHLAGVEPGAWADRLMAAATAARHAQGEVRFVEAEVDTLDQLDRILSMPPGLIDIVLLDNFRVNDLREAVRRRDRRQPSLALEASGGVTLETIRAIAETGIDRISVGALTHSAVSLDFGLDAV